MVDPGGETVLYTKRRALHKTPAASTDLRVCEHMYRCLCLRSYRATALPDTDTKSYTDMHKIHRAIEKDVSQVASKLSEEQCVEVNPVDTVKLCWCDGQAFEREGGLIKRTNGRNRQFVPLDGPFHEATHADFASLDLVAGFLLLGRGNLGVRCRHSRVYAARGVSSARRQRRSARIAHIARASPASPAVHTPCALPRALRLRSPHAPRASPRDRALM